MLHNLLDLLSDPEIQDDFDDLPTGFFSVSGSCPDGIYHDICSGYSAECSEQIRIFLDETFYVESKSIDP